MVSSACTALGGDWFEGEDCGSFSCPQPVPETCPEAEVIASVPFSTAFDNDLAAPSPPPGSCNSGAATEMQNDAWYSYTPEGDCLLTIEVDPDTA